MSTSPVSVPAASARGYDAPARLEDDVLDRRRFAKSIARLATNTPESWSVRIGVHGSWGTGKSTVLDYISHELTAEKHVVVRFNPWHSASSDEMWVQFVFDLHRQVERAGIRLDRDVRKWLKRGLGGALSLARGITVKTESADAALSAAAESLGARRWLKFGPADILNLPQRTLTKRIVVLIDDMDRAPARFVPEILLAVREILDVPGFAFVMAFDREIVARVLQVSGSVVHERNYLEKIIDFAVELPSPKPQQLQALALDEVRRRCPFIDEAALVRMVHLCSPTPRAVKRFVQHLWMLQEQIARHAPSELAWDTMLRVHLVQLESRDLALLVFEEGSASHLSTWHIKEVAGTGEGAGQKARELVSKHVTPEAADRVFSILEELRVHVLHRSSVGYYARLLGNPPPLTEKENDDFWKAWSTDPSTTIIRTWVRAHSESQRLSYEEILAAIWKRSLAKYEDALSRASDSNALVDQKAESGRAESILSLVAQIALSYGDVSASDAERELPSERFEELFAVAMRWAHFTRPDPYPRLREAEQRLLSGIVTSASVQRRALFLALDPMGWNAPRHEEAASLRQSLIGLLEPSLFEAFLDQFARPDLLARLASSKAAVERYLAFGSRGELWNEARLRRLNDMAEEAKNDDVIHENFVDFALLLLDASKGGEVNAEIAAQLARSAWAGMTAQPLQFRSIGTHRDTKAQLERVAGSELQAPAWWDVLGPPQQKAPTGDQAS